jgi:uncharacterized membrane protein
MADSEHTLPGNRARAITKPRLDMANLVGYILLGGVSLSIVLISAGLIWRWQATGQLGLEYSISGMNLFRFVLTDVRQLAAANVRARLLVNLGLAVLLLTPYVRVLASMVYFAFEERNWKYTLFTGFVLSVLTYSLFLH